MMNLIGLTGNPGALRRWMVAGPEIARITIEFEEQVIRGHGGAHDIGNLHHDQKPGVQAAFMKDVRALIALFQEMGNPFLENTQDLLVLDTRDIMETPVAETVRKIESFGEEQYTKFVEERLELCTKTHCPRTSCHSSVGHRPRRSQSSRCNSPQ